MTPEDQSWTGDINDAVVDEWKSDTTPFERVREVLLATTTPAYAKTIAERARVSEPTARTHLQTFVTSGLAEPNETGRGIQYKRSRQTVAMERISEIHTEMSREQLSRGIKQLRQQIQAYQDRYDATDPDDLALQLADEDDGSWEDVANWRATEENLDIAKAALALYDFDPDASNGQERSDDRSATGAFASERDEASA